MEKIRVAVLGGDNRDIILLQALNEKADYELRCYGQPAELLPAGLAPSASLQVALKDADILILPMAGVSDQGMVANVFGHLFTLTAADLMLTAERAMVLSGVAGAYLRSICMESGKILFTTAETDDIAVPNSIPTAEGAISLAIKNSAETINGSRTLIVGYGRVGQALACRMKALGSEVEIVNRGELLREKAVQDGYTVLIWQGFIKKLGTYDYIFNTVPAPVLPASALGFVRKGSLLMELASAPGGIDMKAALEIGLNVMQASGLPGKFSPVSAGKILAAAYPRFIDDFMREAGDANE